MSTSIIEALIVKLGLDSKDVDAKTPAATKKIKDLEAASDKTEKSFKKLTPATKEASRGFDDVARKVGAFLAVLGGTAALKSFIEDTISSNAALERLSRNLNLDVTTLSAWGNAVEQMGGSSKGLQGSLEGLSRAQQEFILTGNSSVIPYFSALNVALVGTGMKARPVTDILLDLADKVQGLDRPMANNILRSIGLDQDTANLVLQGRKEIELTIARQKEFTAVTKAQALEAVKLQRAVIDLKQNFAAFGRDLLQQAAPALEKLLGVLQHVVDWAIANKEFVSDFFTVLAVGLGAVAVAALPLSGTVAVVTALAAAIALLWDDYQTWKRGGDSLIDWAKWEPGIKLATEAVRGLVDLFDQLIHKAQAVAAVFASNMSWTDKLKAIAKIAVRDEAPLVPMRGSVKRAIDKDLSTPELKANAGDRNVHRMQQFFESHGWSPAQANGIVANLFAESRGKDNAVGDHGLAYGIAQWHPDRQAKFKALFGHDIRQSTQQEQMEFVNYELSAGDYAKVGAQLKKQGDAFSAGSLISRAYERPADTMGEAYRRGSLAQQLQGIQGASAPLAQAGQLTAGSQPANVDRSLTVNEVHIHSAATDDPAGFAADFIHAMDYLQTSQANSGLS